MNTHTSSMSVLSSSSHVPIHTPTSSTTTVHPWSQSPTSSPLSVDPQYRLYKHLQLRGYTCDPSDFKLPVQEEEEEEDTEEEDTEEEDTEEEEENYEAEDEEEEEEEEKNEWLSPIDGCPLVTFRDTSSIAIYTGWHTPELIVASGKNITELSTKLKAENIDEEAYLFYSAVSPGIYILEETPIQKANYKWFNGYLRKVKRKQYRQKLKQRRHYIHSQLGYRNGRHLSTTQDFYPAPEFYNIDIDLTECQCCTNSCLTCDHQYPLSDWDSESNYTSDKEMLNQGFITEANRDQGQKSAYRLL